jgi:hypothetical protein
MLYPTELRAHKVRQTQRKNGRGDRIRTCDFLLPKQALYQTELHPGPSAKSYAASCAGAQEISSQSRHRLFEPRQFLLEFFELLFVLLNDFGRRFGHKTSVA